MKNPARLLGLLFALGAATWPISAGAAAAKEKALGVFGAWRAYMYDEGGQTVCYMVTMKTVKAVVPKKRAPSYLMITHRPIEASTDVVSYGAGAFLDERRGVKLRVGADVFDLFAVHDTAWARDPLIDHKLAKDIRAAPTAQLSAIPNTKHAQPIADIFDLAGAAAAYHAIGKACGLPGDEPKKQIVKKQIAKKRTLSNPHPTATPKPK